jgi:ribosomal protein L16/L10AE
LAPGRLGTEWSMKGETEKGALGPNALRHAERHLPTTCSIKSHPI